MKLRRYEPSDLPAVYEMHQRAGYGFEFPELERMVSSWVAEEDDRIIGWAGAALQPEVTMILDPRWGSPHWREGLIKTFHKPLGVDLEEKGYKKAFANIDPKYKNFKRTLARLGWWIGWPTAWVKTESR